ncbi:MAG TPA: hypothetical protein VGB13_00690, partial [Candidatus Krumholzibacteria bacterium]
TVKVVKQNGLVSGTTRSCGCLIREAARKNLKLATIANRKHGATSRDGKSREYHSWDAMRSRCYRRTDPVFKWYGRRGIKVCARWRDNFSAFLEDMGPRPVGTSLDRIDNEGNYTPSNCRWATHAEQSRNKRSQRLLTVNGETKCIQDWAKEAGLYWSTIDSRLSRGWSPEDAVSKTKRRKRRLIRHRGQVKTVTEWARHFGIKVPTLHWRLNHGVPFEQAIKK